MPKNPAAVSRLLPCRLPFSEVRSLPGAFTHSPLAFKRANPVSIRPFARVSVLPLMAKSPSIRPYFCPHSQHSSQRSCKSGQPRKLIVFAEANGDVGVGDEACVLRRRVVVQVLNVRQPRRMVAHEQRGVHLTALRFNFVPFSEGAETTLKLFHCWPPSDSAGVRNVMR